MKIGVLGSGTMGSGIVQTLALSGYKVFMRDINEAALEHGLKAIQKQLAKMVEKEKITDEMRQSGLENITLTTSVFDLADCDVIIEAATENMVIKKKIFEELDQVIKAEAILATNTSSLSITEIASATKRPDRVIGMHFFNPVPVMMLVEVIKGISTSEQTYQVIETLARTMGKEPVKVEEAPGFVVNRILVPMINEAIGILADGVACAEDIDKAMKLGANHPIGPLALADLIGNDVCLAIMEVLYTEFSDSKYRPHPLLKKMVRANKLGRKTGEGFYVY